MAFEYRRNNWWKEYDKYLEKTVTAVDIKKSALKKLNLVEDDPDLQTVKPIFLHGLKFDGFWRQAKNGTYRTSKHEYTYIVFKQDQVLFYIANIDLLDPTKKKESTLEFFYTDITSVNTTTVSTKPKQANLEDNKRPEEIETEAFVIIVPGDKIALAFIPDDDSSSSLSAMKALIRERKKA